MRAARLILSVVACAATTSLSAPSSPAPQVQTYPERSLLRRRLAGCLFCTHDNYHPGPAQLIGGPGDDCDKCLESYMLKYDTCTFVQQRPAEDCRSNFAQELENCRALCASGIH
mmetsp:Transcript_42946/g.84694  ORF Transcript_42946/g.84694 Transcript_42946/m.84694 type:complete len:114 (-) Transcript_42946:204-545(-)